MAMTRSSYWPSAMSVLFLLEREPGFTGAVGDARDAAVVLVATAVEDHGLDAGRLGALAHELAHLLGGVDGAAGTAERLLGGGRRRDGDTLHVVDHLRVDVLVRAEHREARTRRGAAHLLADPPVASVLGDLSVLHVSCLRVSSYFADLPALRSTRSSA